MVADEPSLSATNRSDMALACFITTYKRPAVLDATIRAVFAQTRPPQTLLVVDNGSGADARAVVEAFADDRLLYLDPGENLGSAGGCAFGQRWLRDRGFEWVQLVDDDNPPRTDDTFERTRALTERYADDNRVGVVGATGQRWDWSRGEYARLDDADLAGDVDVDVVGGNHMLTVRGTVIDDVGTPEPALFFGFWEAMYCLEVKRAGYRIVIDGGLMHEWRRRAAKLGRGTQRSLVPKDPESGLWRRYYTNRNYIDRMRVRFDRPDLARRAAVRAVGRSVAAFGRGPRYGVSYAGFAVRGVVDGYRGRLGRNVEPRAKTTVHG